MCARVWSVQRVARAPSKSLDATKVMLFLIAYGRAEVQLHSLLVSELDRFVPDKTSCSLIAATGTKIQFKIFRKDKMVIVRQKDETGTFSVAP